MTASKTATPPSDNGAVDAAQPESLDTVRDILFGGHMRAVEGRISRMEERLAREQAEMRASFEKSLAGLEALAKSEFEALTEKLKAERAQRVDALTALEAALRDSIKALDRRIGELDEATSGADADLRSQVLERQRETAADLNRLSEALTGDLRQAERSLRAEKADLSTLLSIFSNVAVKLGEEIQPPAGS